MAEALPVQVDLAEPPEALREFFVLRHWQELSQTERAAYVAVLEIGRRLGQGEGVSEAARAQWHPITEEPPAVGVYLVRLADWSTCFSALWTGRGWFRDVDSVLVKRLSHWMHMPGKPVSEASS